ncbi:MAG: thiamine phosphate synthase [Thermodesulfovibrio sp.]|nr:thiamine phosphate synthase [Thermodesulfovibrio sp.]
MKKSELPSICLIISSNDIPTKAERALQSGIKWIQLREKDLPRKNILYSALKLKELTNRYNAILTINDYLDVAIASEAEGIHLGQDDLPIEVAKKLFFGIIGISTHNLQEALEAEKKSADYIGFGPIFKTFTKRNALEPRGLSMLSLIQKKINIPVVAIGGINLENIQKIIECGCKNIAVSSGILFGNLEKNIETFINIFDQSKEK